MAAPEPGQRFEAPYPFVHDTYIEHYEGEEGWAEDEIQTWKPGTRQENDGRANVECEADALGKIVLTVVSVHKPGRYPTRVFYTRTWIDPDGKAFGKTKCRVTTAPAFLSLTRGYRHPFILLGCDCKACDWPECDHRLGASA